VIVNGEKISEAPNKQTESSVSHDTWTYTPWTCDVNAYETCDGHETFTAPAGEQVCKVTYVETTHDGPDAWFNFAASSFYPYDQQSPDRYRAVELYIHAGGSHSPFGSGSKEVVNITIDTIPAEADNFTRYYEGCQMPAHD